MFLNLCRTFDMPCKFLESVLSEKEPYYTSLNKYTESLRNYTELVGSRDENLALINQ